MALTPETLPRHELNGLCVRVVDATNADLVGVAGRVVEETTNTLRVESRRPAAEDAGDRGASRVRQVPKQGTTFEFALTDDADDAVRDAGGVAKASGTGSEPTGECASGHADTRASGHAGEDAAHVTVDGARLLSRPARRTEDGGESRWR